MFLSKDFIETAEGLIFAVVNKILNKAKCCVFCVMSRTSTDGKKSQQSLPTRFWRNIIPIICIIHRFWTLICTQWR